MDEKTLVQLQNLPLDVKINKTKIRIKEWMDAHGEDGVYISFSGGKDSTVLLNIARQVYPDTKAVYVDTGLEYPEVKQFVKRQYNVEIIRPDMSFKQVIEKFGYPIISKEQSQYIYEARHSTDNMRKRRMYGDKKGRFKISDKWMYLLDAPFEISHKCCNEMKKKPVKKYERTTGRKPITATMASESILRKQSYLKNGCNSFNSKRPISQPMGFWTEQDVLEYIDRYKIPIAKVYGNVVKCCGSYKTTGCDRTGCVFCAFGCHLEHEPNRFQRLKVTHPKLHDYCINKLGFGDVLDYIDVKYD